MNRDKVGAIVYLILILSAGVLTVNYVGSTRVSSSWIIEIENFLQKENWVPNNEFEPMQDWAFFLHEDGTEQYFVLESQNDFISYINSVMNGINRRIEKSLPVDSLDEILTNNKVLELYHRFPTKSNMWKTPNNFGHHINYDRAYFVLEETPGQSQNPRGTIIVREINGHTCRYSVWQQSKGYLW